MGRKHSAKPKTIPITFRVDSQTAATLDAATARFCKSNGVTMSTPQWCRRAATIVAAQKASG
jgi:hypothetical protein